MSKQDAFLLDMYGPYRARRHRVPVLWSRPNPSRCSRCPPRTAAANGRILSSRMGGAIIVVLVAVGSLAGIYWHNFGEPRVSEAAKAESVAAKSLRDLREML
jgi:hypothetical protein